MYQRVLRSFRPNKLRGCNGYSASSATRPALSRYFSTHSPEIERSLLSYHQKLDMIKKEQTQFVVKEPLEKIDITTDFANIGVNFADLAIYRIQNKRPIPEDRSINYPSNSFMRVVFPFETNPNMRKFMVRVGEKKIRVGRLLEIMDLMAGRVCYMHCNSSFETRDITIVTASVDGIQFYPNELDILKNVTIDAYICYTGSSSMEVRIDVFNSEMKLHCTACYIMVCRDNKTGKAKPVPQLAFDQEVDADITRMRFSIGKLRQQNRLEKSKNSLYKELPTWDEMKVLHAHFREQLEDIDPNKPKKNYLKIQRTEIQKVILKHYQDRNIHGRVFGGLLMRESLELAYACVMLQPYFAEPIIYFIDDIYFIKPVDIGDFIRYTALMTYTEGSLAHVKVEVEKAVIGENDVKYQKATEFNMVLTFKKPEGKDLIIIPETYEEAMLYLDARRRIKKLLEHDG